MIEHRQWFAELSEKLDARFGDRLLFVGYQGSYRRGEATEASDLDAVVVLDVLGLDDLAAYREILSGMPETEKACGFVGGKEELRHWPRHELFQFAHETVALRGSLDDILPSFGRGDIAEGARIGVATMYHMLCHTYVHGDADGRLAALGGAYKGSFFILQALHYLRTGEYPLSKVELLPLLQDDERKILETCIALKDGRPLRDNEIDEGYALLLKWCADTLTGLEAY
jgi:Nucleotidyltransferase domain.